MSLKKQLRKAKSTKTEPKVDWVDLLENQIPTNSKINTGTSMLASLSLMIQFLNYKSGQYKEPDIKSVQLIIHRVLALKNTPQNGILYDDVHNIVKEELSIPSATEMISTETASTETASTETVETSVSISTGSTDSITPNIDSLKKNRDFANFWNTPEFNSMFDKLNRDKLIFLDNYLLQFKSNKPTLNLFQLLNELIWVGEYLASGADDTIGRIVLISQKRFALRTAMRELKQIDQSNAFAKVIDFEITYLSVTYQDMTTRKEKTVVHNMDTIISDTNTLETFCENLNALKTTVITSLMDRKMRMKKAKTSSV